jgi:hypothetical protein
MNMHKVPKWILNFGGLFIILGLVVLQLGGFMMDLDTAPSSEDWSGTLMFEGDTPTTFEAEFKWIRGYSIFVQDGSNVTIEVINSDTAEIYEPCQESDACDLYDIDGHIDGYHYIGDLDFEEVGTGTYEIIFTEKDGEASKVMIREDTSFAGFLVLAGGVIGCFAGIILLIIGGILTRVMKEETKVEFTPVMTAESDDGIQKTN